MPTTVCVYCASSQDVDFRYLDAAYRLGAALARAGATVVCGAGNQGLTPDIHTRKERMAAMADAVVALPGGCGTLEELLEIITWKQLGLYKGKIVIVNTEGFFTPLLQMLQRCVDEGFMKQSHKTLWTVAETPEKASSEALAADKSIVEPKR